MDKLAENLRRLMTEFNLSETELSRRTGIGQPVIHRMSSGETDNPKVGTLSPIANLFNVSISQLVGDEVFPEYLPPKLPDSIVQGWNEIPLLSIEDIILHPFPLDSANKFEKIYTDARYSNGTYAIRIQDSTMQPRFPEGTVVVIDPNHEPQDQDFAVVYIHGHRKATFKQVLLDGDDIYLKPLNSVSPRS